MDLTLSEDEETIQEVFRAIFEKEATPQESGLDERLWGVLAESGAFGMALKENDGSIFNLALLASEAGRTLASGPIVETALAAWAIDRALPGDSLVERLATGELVGTLALKPAATGVSPLVIAGASAGLVLALDGDELVAVESAPGESAGDLGFLGIAPRALSGAGVERRVLATGAAARQIFDDAVRAWRIATASALAGLANKALHIGVDYAKQRIQFGAPIGSFQAVQHRLADVATSVEGAELLVRRAAWSADTTTADWHREANMAFAFAAKTAQEAATSSLHFHGGYGVALEYEIHRYVRRAKGWALASGDPEELWQEIGTEHVAQIGKE